MRLSQRFIQGIQSEPTGPDTLLSSVLDSRENKDSFFVPLKNKLSSVDALHHVMQTSFDLAKTEFRSTDPGIQVHFKVTAFFQLSLSLSTPAYFPVSVLIPLRERAEGILRPGKDNHYECRVPSQFPRWKPTSRSRKPSAMQTAAG